MDIYFRRTYNESINIAKCHTLDLLSLEWYNYIIKINRVEFPKI